MVVLSAAGVEGLFGPVIGDREATRGARRTLRAQIARLERDLAETTSTGFPRNGVGVADTRVAARARGPRLLDLGELESLRDDLAIQLKAARARVAALGERQQRARERLEAMLLEPRKHKFARVSFEELGERSCGDWLVRPRLGLLGMLMGWWQIKLSSGCPLGNSAPEEAPLHQTRGWMPRGGSLFAWGSAHESVTSASRATRSRPSSGLLRVRRRGRWIAGRAWTSCPSRRGRRSRWSSCAS
jgi:outer membrane murein-binding lipoprotein Lpp